LPEKAPLMDQAADFRPWQLIGLGSLPWSDVEAALDLVLDCFPEIPFWPQLPPRSPWEDMICQFAPGLPGLEVDLTGRRVRVDPEADLPSALTEFYQADLNQETDRLGLTPEAAPGFFGLLDRLAGRPGRVERLKGQVPGPLIFGQAVKDQAGRAIISDPELRSACARGLGLKGAWQAERLSLARKRCLIMVDDPGFYLLGSPFLALSPGEALDLLAACLEPIRRAGALTGVHCCANTDWSLLLGAEVDVLSFDAFSFGQSLALFPGQVAEFLERGGWLTWGLVPTQKYTGQETPEGVVRLLDSLIRDLAGRGVPADRLWSQALLSPACGLGSLTPEAARAVLDLLERTRALILG